MFSPDFHVLSSSLLSHSRSVVRLTNYCSTQVALLDSSISSLGDSSASSRSSSGAGAGLGREKVDQLKVLLAGVREDGERGPIDPSLVAAMVERCQMREKPAELPAAVELSFDGKSQKKSKKSVKVNKVAN